MVPKTCRRLPKLEWLQDCTTKPAFDRDIFELYKLPAKWQLSVRYVGTKVTRALYSISTNNMLLV
jgi:hypothetical protein